MDITWTARRRAEGDGTSYTTADGRFFVRKDGNTWGAFAHVAGTGIAGHRFNTAAAARAEVEAHIERTENAAVLAEQAARTITIHDRNDTLVANDYGSGNVVISARDENSATVIIIDENDRRALAAFLLEGLDEVTPAPAVEPTPDVVAEWSANDGETWNEMHSIAAEHRGEIVDAVTRANENENRDGITRLVERDRPAVGTAYLDPATGEVYRVRTYYSAGFGHAENDASYGVLTIEGAQTSAHALPAGAVLVWTPERIAIEPTDAEIAAHEAGVERRIAEHEERIAADED